MDLGAEGFLKKTLDGRDASNAGNATRHQFLFACILLSFVLRDIVCTALHSTITISAGRNLWLGHPKK
eukprot:2075985-Amphidinium_carterae.1